ncbi:alpha/beta fold hydrolase [Palleronia sediminis]|uniref:alpha/beta fold hydrolase n=1 Tax=Palleronia sediminis TaxID=2547833 RepID=UPI001F104ADA|nr:alpha/beta hydrolase [Palleronia sediminis]
MTRDSAPFHADIARAPDGTEAQWLRAEDGVRLRVGCCMAGRRGTVLLFPGRTEYVEKYGPTMAALERSGLSVAAIDWRGQGLADRIAPDPLSGHVDAFGDYQRDVAAMVALGRAEGWPEPWHLLAHSMGGAIGLRALLQGLPVARAAFSAPMWGISIAPPLRPFARAVSWMGIASGRGHAIAPLTSRRPYADIAPFAMNLLTGDEETFDWLADQTRTHPELALAGPSLGWLGAALRECRALAREPSPDVPALCLLGSREHIVDRKAVTRRMAEWPGGRLIAVEGGRHEVLMETPPRREMALFEIAAHFDGATRADPARTDRYPAPSGI